MTYPRAHTVNPDVSGTYLCTSRCVRRAWLCGEDSLSGRSYAHRKAWIEARLVELSTIFAVSLASYAVMSNHYHAVLTTHPEVVPTWSDEEVAERWLRLSKPSEPAVHARRVAGIVADEARLKELRKRLSSLSWYMKSVNEPLARLSNREDGCKGRFWEGRFHSEALLDEAAVAAGMAYVDLNPVRAGLAEQPESAPYSAIARRVSGGSGLAKLEDYAMSLGGYLELLRWTQARGKLPRMKGTWTMPCTQGDWLARIEGHRRPLRARGCRRALKRFARALGQQWLKGQSGATET